MSVTLVEKAARVLPALLGQYAADFLAGHISRSGIRLILNAGVSCIESQDQKVCGVQLDDGTHIPASLVIIATGLRANTQLCHQAGIACGPQGVIVDSYLRTNQPDIMRPGI